MNVWVPAEPRRRGCWIPGNDQMWVLGSKFRASGSTVSALNHQAISQASGERLSNKEQKSLSESYV